MDLTRRALLASLAAAGLAGRARADGRPVRRQAGPEGLEAIFARSGLAQKSGFCLVDLADGRVIEAHRADIAFPPASVTKIVTTLYALDALGPDYRFATRLVAGAAPAGGRLEGDLLLVGGGDPVLDTDQLGDLIGGIGRLTVSGGLKLATGALPAIAFIDPDQPDGAGYNPGIGGLNLNFNRVFLQWSPGKAGPQIAFRAPGERFSVDVPTVSGALADGVRAPRRAEADSDALWLLPPLAGTGSLWLPVRAPGPYAGQVIRALAAEDGTALPAAEIVGGADGLAGGPVLGEHLSDPSLDLMRGMLFHSTNLTAEVLGLRASQVRGAAPVDLAGSAATMTEWARGRFGLLPSARFVNHSGLSDRTRLTPAEQIRVLSHDPDRLAGLLRTRTIADGAGGTFQADGVQLVCKTGTLDFVSALAGYLEGPGPRRLAFAIFAADPEARAAISEEERANPPGAKAWAGRARGQQAALLRRWIALEG
ncbi:MAG: D-alanyl-D-alanine carboxypeptidase [Amaricoccus sp.]